MNNMYNSFELAKKVGDCLNLKKSEQKALHDELSQISNGPLKNVLAALSDKVQEQNDSLHNYVACIKGNCVRNAQYSRQEDTDPLDDEMWTDAESRPIFLEVVAAKTPTRAKQIAAIHVGINENIIELYPI